MLFPFALLVVIGFLFILLKNRPKHYDKLNPPKFCTALKKCRYVPKCYKINTKYVSRCYKNNIKYVSKCYKINMKYVPKCYKIYIFAGII